MSLQLLLGIGSSSSSSLADLSFFLFSPMWFLFDPLFESGVDCGAFSKIGPGDCRAGCSITLVDIGRAVAAYPFEVDGIATTDIVV